MWRCRGFAGAIALSLLGPPLAHGAPALFTWEEEFTEASSPALKDFHERIHSAHPGALRAIQVSDQVWSEEDFELRIASGTLFLEPPIDGVVAGAFFEGSATLSFTPRTPAARATLETDLGRADLVNLPVASAYIFSVRPDSLFDSPGVGEAGAIPRSLDTYVSDKSAMRQLGLGLTWTFLNRDGPARGATYVLFPMEEIRTRRSKEARLLYAFNPMQHVSLAVFGHDEIVALRPYKFKFYNLASYPTRSPAPGVAVLSRSTVRMTLGSGARGAVEEASLQFSPGSSERGLRLRFTTRLKVSGVTDHAGNSLPFLQWSGRRNTFGLDETILIALGGGAEVPGALTIRSEGILFEPWFSSFVLLDEDDWHPRPYAEGAGIDSHHELDLTIPKRYQGIGIGEKVLEEEHGASKRVVYRTTQPIDQSTFYYGDYLKTEGMADSTRVELYQHRMEVGERQNAQFTLTEITNAIKVFNKMFVPLDIRSLRVTSTRTGHGRGFEGLILMGGRGTEVASDSGADLFRAHEVAHQWWGNYVRTRHWPEDRWLSEAFAEYSAMEYYKVRFDDHKKSLELMATRWMEPLTAGSMQHERLTGAKETVAGRTVVPLVAGSGNVYTKGPAVLHMLRYLFHTQRTDEAFFTMLKDFLQTYRYRAACTTDFQEIAEKHLGADLDWFFRQWVREGGVPVLAWKHTTAQEQGSWVVRLRAEQRQKEYRLVVPIYFHFPGDKIVVRPWIIDGGSAERSIKVPAKPSAVTLNDNLEALVILKPL